MKLKLPLRPRDTALKPKLRLKDIESQLRKKPRD